jgi:RNA polymerase sigma factor (sigma-70 family)
VANALLADPGDQGMMVMQKQERISLVARDGRHYRGAAMAPREEDSDPTSATCEPQAGAAGAVGQVDQADQAEHARIDRACAGDAMAIAQLIRDLLPTVRVVLRARLGGAVRADAARSVDDLAQDVFLQLFADDGRVLRRWQPGRGLPLARFVALIADRYAISEMRVHRATDQALEIGTVADSLHAEEVGPEAWMHSHQALRLLFDAMNARLSPLGRRLFRLLFVDELDIEEICLRTGMGADAVYAWRSRLRRQAAQLFECIEAPVRAGAH